MGLEHRRRTAIHSQTGDGMHQSIIDASNLFLPGLNRHTKILAHGVCAEFPRVLRTGDTRHFMCKPGMACTPIIDDSNLLPSGPNCRKKVLVHGICKAFHRVLHT